MWDVVYFWTAALIMIYKGNALPYPTVGHNYWGLEFSYLFMYIVVEWLRLTLMGQGNAALSKKLVYRSLLITPIVIYMHVYYMVQQTYILEMEVLLNAISIATTGITFMSGWFVAMGLPDADADGMRWVGGGNGNYNGNNWRGGGAPTGAAGAAAAAMRSPGRGPNGAQALSPPRATFTVTGGAN
jgi:transmembrane protein 216